MPFHVMSIKIPFHMSLVLSQTELKNLIDISSSSFEFAKELIRHNLVSSLEALTQSMLLICVCL